jgi:hypothetical protein
MIACTNGPEVILFGIPFTTAHKAHRKLSVKMALKILKPILEARKAFESFRKQDDRADACNQTITVLFCKNKLPYTRDEMKYGYMNIR